jgi:hypothetical protein
MNSRGSDVVFTSTTGQQIFLRTDLRFVTAGFFPELED